MIEIIGIKGSPDDQEKYFSEATSKSKRAGWALWGKGKLKREALMQKTQALIFQNPVPVHKHVAP